MSVNANTVTDQNGYSKDNPPTSCMDCLWHNFTFSLSTGCRTMWSDTCGFTKTPFGKMHIILRGEYRSLNHHDEDDLVDHVPYECPYFDSSKIFWEMYGRVKMDFEIFVYECENHPDEYRGKYVYSLPENISYLMGQIPSWMGLKYLNVTSGDRSWFITTFGERSVMISTVSPVGWQPSFPNS